jgi:hypothetical protein
LSNFLKNTIDLEKIYNEVNGIGDLINQIKDTLNGGDSGGNTPSESTLITFYITHYNGSNLEYQAEEGMTWAEWCESEYNTDGYTYEEADVSTIDGYVYIVDGPFECTISYPADSQVTPYEEIINGTYYDMNSPM